MGLRLIQVPHHVLLLESFSGSGDQMRHSGSFRDPAELCIEAKDDLCGGRKTPLFPGKTGFFEGRAGFFRVGELPLPRRGFDALPTEKASIDRP
jgi:hypothetical protein